MNNNIRGSLRAAALIAMSMGGMFGDAAGIRRRDELQGQEIFGVHNYRGGKRGRIGDFRTKRWRHRTGHGTGHRRTYTHGKVAFR
jgi:hypothetical protein